ncbi:MAG: PKD domain-containing protein, partial [Bacteroidales bacterium]|nr:PKD domain-containing protein [Bacteroidales bacterium]
SILILCISIFLYSNAGLAQNTSTLPSENSSPEWVEMMKDLSVNFYDVRETANNYFETHPKGKGSGWKQYKRWEYFTEQRVYPTGERINHAQVWNEITKFNKEYPSENKENRNSWTPLGPSTSLNVTGHWNPGIGRINVIALKPGDPQTIYIGAPSGGLWKTTDEGANWVTLTDNQPVLGVSAIAIHPTNTDIIYIGTGDNDHNDNYSIGVLKSTDAGQTWNTTGLDWTIYQNRTISKLLINPNDPDILFAATTNGIYRTTNAGSSWTNIFAGNIDDMEFKPGDPNTIYAVTKRFYKSVDGGNNFTETTGVSNASRVQIAVTEDNPDYVYFFSSATGIYRSENSGDSFTLRSSQPNQGSQAWYDLAFCVSHENAEEVHLGEINTWKSTNGAQSWTKTTDWTWGNSIGYTHCDIHEMVFYGGVLYVGSDGLICKSTDGASTWTNLTEGVSIRQFYKIGTSKNDPYKILGGSQDNGTSVYTTDHWHEWLGADGMECVVDYTNSDIVYGTSQMGHFYKSNNGGNFGNVGITQPGGGNWVTPFVIHPIDNETLFVGNSEVRKTTNGMNNWTTISSLGLGDLNTLAIAESNGDYLYTSKSSTIYKTTNGGSSWANISDGLPNKHITYIAIHPENPEMIAVSLSGYSDGEKVYISDDAGETWTNYSLNLPNIPANCVAFYSGNLNPLYVGMDVGVYYIDDNLTEWTSYMDELPNVIVNELEIQFDSQLLRAGTFGRGLWESSLQLNPALADFIADQTTIPIECSINFTSLSQGPPDSFEWIFEGGTPATSTEENPTNILYNIEGTYDVQLIVANSVGSDTLIKEDYITVSSSLLPSTDFITNDSVTCSNQEVEFIDQTFFCPNTWEWSFNPATVSFVDGTNANSQNPKVVFDPGVYSVTLTTSNAVGNNTLTKTDYIFSGGLALPFTEDFEAGSLEDKGWVIENPDESVTWDITTVEGSSPGDKAAWMNIINYMAMGQRDRMISPALDLSGFTDLNLEFDHAYAQRYYQKDSLIVYISDDCGESWTRIFANGPDGTGIFATSPTTTAFFAPESSEDWCGEGYGSTCNIIDLNDWIGSNNVKIMFESYCHFGNNMYLDNILIANTVGINEFTDGNFQIDILPNPSLGIFNISVKKMTGNIIMKIMNPQGQVILLENITDIKNGFDKQIDLSDQAKGIYFVEIRSDKISEVRKILIK